MDTIELTYHEGKDGMLYPNITVEPDTGRTLGKFGIMAADYLKENYYSRYRSLIRFGRLTEVLSKVEEEANQLLEQIMEKYLKSHKPKDSASTMEMWEIREQGQRMAEEIVLHQIVNKYH